MSVTEAFSIIASIVSIILGFFAIWMTWNIKVETDGVNRSTTQLLIEIRTDAKSLSAYGIAELQRYGETSRQVITGALSGASLSVKADAISATPANLSSPPAEARHG